jgi:hypothetical protein
LVLDETQNNYWMTTEDWTTTEKNAKLLTRLPYFNGFERQFRNVQFKKLNSIVLNGYDRINEGFLERKFLHLFYLEYYFYRLA